MLVKKFISCTLLLCLSFILNAKVAMADDTPALNTTVSTANTAETTETNNDEEESDFSWQIMVNFAVMYDPTILKDVEDSRIEDFLALAINLDLYYKGFYIQSNQRRAGSRFYGAELGYQLLVKEHWALDILTKNYISGYSSSDILKYQDNPAPTLEGLPDRDDGNGLAIRYSHFFEQGIFTLDLAALYIDGDDDYWLVDSFYSHRIPYKNWDIYLGGGGTYYSNGVMDYYLGINPDEVNEFRPLHQSSSGYRIQAEVYAQHPISESWSFNAGITQSYYSNSTMESPLADKQYITQLLLGVMYVF